MLTRLREPADFQPARNIDAFFWLNHFAPLFLSLRICLALLLNKSIYMHFTSICNICQVHSGIC